MNGQPNTTTGGTLMRRMSIRIHGAVQGVGFRPFVYRLARELGVNGWVANSPEGVRIEAESAEPRLEGFLLRLQSEKPCHSHIHSLECSLLDPRGYGEFEIRSSASDGTLSAIVMPDIATCPDCLAEVFTPSERRYLYPFTNCTNCGPRFSIIEKLPYDRPNTSMKQFQMCEDCRMEYENPLDRRFHAQPIACPVCGPRLALWNPAGDVIASQHDALGKALEAIRSGAIVAVKGLGGFHLVVDARNEDAVARLRNRKQREEKPFALLFPSIEVLRDECEISSLEKKTLLSPAAPIVLLRRRMERSTSTIAPSVAPRNPSLGVMVPSTPLHHILLRLLNFPIVATSGNLTDEPICTDEHEALERLRGIADEYLVHDRPIVRHMDDSIVKVMFGRELVIRRARGYAPLPLQIDVTLGDGTNHDGPRATVLAVGGQMKNTVALTVGNNVFVSQHIGDLETTEAYDAFEHVVRSFNNLYGVQPSVVACDMHPRYLSGEFARRLPHRREEIQHHHAHVAACMAENQLTGQLLGVSWDGSGYGDDGTIWGGEFLVCDEGSFKRMASLRQFRLLGGEKAVREPRRAAIGLLYEVFGDGLFTQNDSFPLQACTGDEMAMFRQILGKDVGGPLTSSAGRLFDAVSSIIGLRQKSNFEGQAAMELEYLTDGICSDETYPFSYSGYGPPIVIDWGPMVVSMIDDLGTGVSKERISCRFHNTLAEIILGVALRLNERRVILSGGCFQNTYLTERTLRRLQDAGFHPYWHQRIPPNDGGISLGQSFIALARSASEQTVQQDSQRLVLMTP